MNCGDPLQANRLVQPLLAVPEYAMDAQLTNDEPFV
jgi:hypothetical protein